MKTRIGIVAALASVFLLAGCSTGYAEPSDDNTFSPTTEEGYGASDDYASRTVFEKTVELSDGTKVLCLVSPVRGGYDYECDWSRRE